MLFRETDLREKRGQYSELNSFTVNQLLILRRELAKLLPNASATSASFNNRVSALLFDVAGRECDRDSIRAVLHTIDAGLRMPIVIVCVDLLIIVASE